jgi:outer membrane protein TolC
VIRHPAVLACLYAATAVPLRGQQAPPELGNARAVRPTPSVASVQEVEDIESITLEEAVRRATSFDPEYVAALGRIDNAAWSRRAAVTAFVLPSVQASATLTRASSEFFNIGTAELTTQLVQGTLQGSLNLFQGGAKFFELTRSRAEIDASISNEVQALYQTALDTEADYYDVLAGKELRLVAQERVRRAAEQLAIARARVVSGAAVQTDSLQLLLELTRAQVDLLQEDAALRVARYALGRRVGAAGPVDAASVDTMPAPLLPITELEAIAEALESGPDYQTAAAEERGAQAFLSQQRAAYLPSVDLFGQVQSFDDRFFPTATVRSQAGFVVTIPLWNGAQREIQVSQARVQRDVARTRREQVERSVRRDVVQAYATYNTARASAELAARAVVVATENLRVQESRYRSGATTILDLITAQVDLADAEAVLVQARYATRLALAGLEALLGRRLFPDRIEP